MEYFLNIIIPQYNETDSIVSKLLNSISVQRGINFNEVKITIVNDHSETLLTDALFTKYKNLNIEYLRTEKNAGPGPARQFGIDKSNAKYVMFIDSDDELFNDTALYIVIGCLKQTNSNLLITNFVYENGNSREIMDGSQNFQYLHGKVVKREFLLENNIRFHSDIKYAFEDKYFTSCLVAALGDLSTITTLNYPTYLWKQNPTSITNKKRNKPYLVENANDDFICITGSYDYYKSKGMPEADEFIVDALFGFYQLICYDKETYGKYSRVLKDYIKTISECYNKIPEGKQKELFESQLKATKGAKVNSSATYNDFIKFVKED